jgi:hypothetical protein
MAAIQDLMDIEGQIEAALETHLTAKGLHVDATDQTGILETPRVEVEAVVTGEGPHEVKVGDFNVYDQFSVALEVRLMVAPRNGQDPASFRGVLRAALLDYPAIRTLLTDLEIAPETWRTTSGMRMAMEAEDIIALTVSYSLEVYVKPAAWPASIVYTPPAPPAP